MKAHAILLLHSVDLPARAMVLNSKQWNGKFGCCYCKFEGVNPPGNTLVRYWPPERHSTIRTHASLMQNAREAVRTGKPVCCMVYSF